MRGREEKREKNTDKKNRRAKERKSTKSTDCSREKTMVKCDKEYRDETHTDSRQ